jgi:molybdate transport system permease protein
MENTGTQSKPTPATSPPGPVNPHRVASDFAFHLCLAILCGSYILLIALMLIADMVYTTPGTLLHALDDPKIRYSMWLSLISCSITTILSLWVAVPVGYVMSRTTFRGKAVIDAILDIPIVLPPLVVGLSLLILFRLMGDIWVPGLTEKQQPFLWLRNHVVFEIPGVILAQFMVACAFAVRTMRAAFDQIPPRAEQVAQTLGCSRGQAFFAVALPQARRGMLTAGTLAWARSLGEFGPILIFAGSTRMHTEVLPTSVFLEMQAGNLAGALAVSLIMVFAAVAVLITARVAGVRNWG